MRRMIVLFTAWLVLPGLASADDWPQWRGPQRDGKWNESDVIQRLPEGKLRPLWQQPIGPGYCGPTVADGRVFVMDRITQPEQAERILCFDSKSGERIWERQYPCVYRVGYPAGPRASVTVDGSRAYAIGAMGHMTCLDVADGTVVWHRDLNSEYKIAESKRMPIWGISAAPLVYQDVVILHIGGADGACIVGLDKGNGSEIWRALDDPAQYSAPVIARHGDQTIVLCWTGGSVAGLDPTSGNVFWRHPFQPSRMPIGIATPLVRGELVFLTSFYDGSMMLRMHPTEMRVEEVWRAAGPNERDTRALHSIMSTPIWLGDHIYGVCSYGEFRCLQASNGQRVWENQLITPRARWSNVHFVENGDVIWMFNERGQLITGRLSPEGYQEISRADLIEPTEQQLRERGGVCWSHPAFADRCVFIRNDEKLICVNLAR